MIPLQIGLPGHDARLHEEQLLAAQLGAGFGVDTGVRVGEGAVGDWHVAHDPGVHVQAAGLDEDAFGGLGGGEGKGVSGFFQTVEGKGRGEGAYGVEALLAG